MKIAILGGGITGLTAAYDLAKAGHKVTLFEKEAVLGGLATGFKGEGWQWPLERAYHHLFASDSDILEFAREIGFDKIFFKRPITASLYEQDGRLKIFQLDNPLDLLKFPLLSFIDRVRLGITLVALKLSPFLPLYQTQTLEEFMAKTAGKTAYEVMFGELMRKKYGKYAGKILASFIWTRINKRTPQLGYMEGGFQTFVDYLADECKKLGVEIRAGQPVGTMSRLENGTFTVGEEEYDRIVSTLPSPVLVKLGPGVLPAEYLEKLAKIEFLNATVLILETKTPLLSKEYWLSDCVADLPFMVALQHTNYIDKSHYSGNHILYVANYPDYDSLYLKMTPEEATSFFLPYLQKINPEFGKDIVAKYYWKAPFAQPIFSREFLENKPDFITPTKNFYIANLDMTYPYDRGTNYAVKLGRDVARIILYETKKAEQ